MSLGPFNNHRRYPNGLLLLIVHSGLRAVPNCVCVLYRHTYNSNNHKTERGRFIIFTDREGKENDLSVRTSHA